MWKLLNSRIRGILTSGLCLVIFFYAKGEPKQNPPNIVLIYMDDMGIGDVSSFGALGYLTPNIDKLSNSGMRFTNFYTVQPICAASRAALMTGCYPNRIGLFGALQPGSKIGISERESTIGDLLKGVGYATACVGKWHLGDHYKFLPLQHGFDYYFGLPYSNDMWSFDYLGKPVKPGDPFYERKHSKPPLPLFEGNKVIRYVRSMNDQDSLTTWYTEKAIEFIDRNKTKPFFLYLAHSMVHVPLGVTDKFRGKSGAGLFGDVMMEVDWSVGEIVEKLEEEHLKENTLIIFAADNGPWLLFGNHAGSAGGLREGKATTWEGGLKEPLIVNWPGVVPAGTLNNKLAANIDILPTIAEIAGAQLPKEKIDGVNILSLFKDEDGANPRSNLLFYYNENSLEAVRMGDWKLVLPHEYDSYEESKPGMGGSPGEFPKKRHTDLGLYDLRRDPGERYNVKDQHPEIVKKISVIVENARVDLGDDLTGRKGKNRREPGTI